MASAWGSSWGASWGNSWGSIATATQGSSGGGGGYLYRLQNEQYQRRLQKAMEERQDLDAKVEQVADQIKKADDQQSAKLAKTSAIYISSQIQALVSEFELIAAEYQNRALIAQQQQSIELANFLRALMIEAQLQAELAQERIEELDIVFITMILLAV